ncbi:MAG: type IX secretion system sortase PorU [Bacteroidia bacterium]|nr:type IX secretion system sortase PorU [Bacteroidia bacterium]
MSNIIMFLRNAFYTLVGFLFLVANLDAQEFKRELKWEEYSAFNVTNIPFCSTCDVSQNNDERYISFYSERFKGFSNEKFEAHMSGEIYSVLNIDNNVKVVLMESLSKINDSLFAETQYEADVSYLYVRYPALRVRGNNIERLESFSIELTPRIVPLASPPIIRPGRRGSWPATSVLASGQWYRIAVSQEGIFKMDKSFLESLGMNLSDIDPKTIKIYSGHGTILPEFNSVERPKDLVQNPIYVKGEEDGRFDAADYILFYGNSPSKFLYDSSSNDFVYSKNYYAKETVYFLTYGGSNGIRITSQSANISQPADIDVSEFDDIYRYEKDLVNLIKTGKIWYGEHFDRTLSYSFSKDFANRVAGSTVKIRTVLVSRSLKPSTFTLNLNGKTSSFQIAALGTLDYESSVIVAPVQRVFNFSDINGSSLNLNVSYDKPLSSSEGWCDYIEFVVKRNLIHSGAQTIFANLTSTQVDYSKFKITSAENIQVWDITDPFNVKIQNTDFVNNEHQFVANTQNVLRRYISTSSYLSPKALSKASNQNLHEIRDVDYIIVTHPDLKSAAENLAQFHRENSGLTVQVVTTKEIFNEFSHGIQDVSAIRDFMKMLWDEASSPQKRPKYLLLFGDASYDFLDILENNTNRVPTFESIDSHNPMVSFCSDDYFVLMDNSEGKMDGVSSIGMLDIAVGRIVANSLADADAVVNKIKNYYAKESFGNWRTNFTFLADDMDNNWESEFVVYNEQYTKELEIQYPYGLYNKLYLDAFEQKSMGGGERYPDAVEAINNNIEKGTLLWSYNGHGGTFGLASERVIVIPQINAWRNNYKLPLFVTATCEFSRFDDPAMVSGGENTLLNPKGGSIGLLTTVRLVLVSTNRAIQDYLYSNSFYVKDDNGRTPIGLIYKETKNRPLPGSGDRFFTFLGDPAVRLAIPRYKAELDSLNGVSLSDAGVDTLKALSKVTFKGRILNDDNSTKSDFNGIVFPTVLDKSSITQTRANGANSVVLDYKVQNNILFRGRVQAKDGKFEFTFIVPKDINYRYDSARISLYADNQTTDAAGYEKRIIVGGAADSVGTDNEGPVLALFLNDFSFVNGGLTNNSPLFIATLHDENGINTAGSGIGREIIATFDKGTKQERSVVLNEFYQTNMNSYQDGELRYRLSNLAPGKHTITLKAWDVYNNSSETTLEFVVDENKDLVLKNLMNYPNPFSTHTTFHFDHNKPGQNLTIQLQIMTISGKVVKNFFSEVTSSDSHLSLFDWDAKDEFGDKLAKGVYIYRIRAKSGEGKWVEKYEKLMLLN